MEGCTAFLLAAGFGTRLRPLTLARPKPLLPVGGVAMLDHALTHLQRHGHQRVLVNAHHLWEQVAAWAEANDAALQVELPEILGTGGGLLAALDRLAETVVIFNGDILTDVDLTALADACPPAGASMALRAVADLGSITPVLADASGGILRIGDITSRPDAPPTPAGGPGVHFTGIHAMSRAAIARTPPGFCGIVRTTYTELVPEGRVQSISHRGTWADLGTPEAYLAANLAVLDRRLALPVDPWSRSQPGPGGSLIGEGAQVEGAVERCVIGAGAVVPAGAVLRDSVVWDGVIVPRERITHAVVYDGGQVLSVPAGD
jgi:mannose-1-phosphate guanylyltransferase